MRLYINSFYICYFFVQETSYRVVLSFPISKVILKFGLILSILIVRICYFFPSAKYLLVWNLIKYMTFKLWSSKFTSFCEMNRNQFGDLEIFNRLYCFNCKTDIQIFPMYAALFGAIAISNLLTQLTIF